MHTFLGEGKFVRLDRRAEFVRGMRLLEGIRLLGEVGLLEG